MGEEGEWQYEYLEDAPPADGTGPAPGTGGIATPPGDDRASFVPYARDMRASGDALLSDLEGLPGVDRAHVARLRKRLGELLKA